MTKKCLLVPPNDIYKTQFNWTSFLPWSSFHIQSRLELFSSTLPHKMSIYFIINYKGRRASYAPQRSNAKVLACALIKG